MWLHPQILRTFSEILFSRETYSRYTQIFQRRYKHSLSTIWQKGALISTKSYKMKHFLNIERELRNRWQMTTTRPNYCISGKYDRFCNRVKCIGLRMPAHGGDGDSFKPAWNGGWFKWGSLKTVTSGMGFEEWAWTKRQKKNAMAFSAKGSAFTKEVRWESTRHIHSIASFEINLVSQLIFRNSGLWKTVKIYIL